MDNVLDKEVLFAAKNEPQIQPKEILAELLPVMKDYFVGEFALEGNALTYKMLNGQKIKIYAK